LSPFSALSPPSRLLIRLYLSLRSYRLIPSSRLIAILPELFVSALLFLLVNVTDFVVQTVQHVVYSASKDWGVNGLRLGVLVSQANPELHTAMESSCLLMKISSASDILWSSLLLDPVALPTYLEMNRSRLAQAYQHAISFLEQHEISYRPSNAGHFVWIDLRRYLPERAAEDGRYLESGVEREEELAKHFLRNGINVVSHRPRFLCFTYLIYIVCE